MTPPINHNPLVGFNTYYAEEESIREYIVLTLSKLYKFRAYSKISIPLLEEQEYFSSEIVGSHPWPSWHPRSLFSIAVKNYNTNYEENTSKVKNCFLIPEGTASVCKWVAENIDKDDFEFNTRGRIKTFYIVNSFRNELVSKISETRLKQFTQIGVENIGQNSLLTDIETLFLLNRSLIELGFSKKSIIIRICDVRIFNEFCKFYNLELNKQYQLKDIVDSISTHRAKGNKLDLLDSISKLNRMRKDLNLNDDSHPISIFTQEYTDLSGTNKQLESYPQEIGTDLRSIISSCKKLDINVVVDFSVIRSQEYYNRLTFQADLMLKDEIVSEIAGGGRYDNFLNRIISITKMDDQHAPITASGFALSLERLVYSMKKSSILSTKKIVYPIDSGIQYVIFPRNFENALRYWDKLANGSKVSELYMNDSNQTNAKLLSESLAATLLMK